MRSPNLVAVAGGLSGLALGYELPQDIVDHAGQLATVLPRDFSTLPLSASSSTSSVAQTTSSSTTTSNVPSTMSTQTGPEPTGMDMTLTTVFTQPPSCTDHALSQVPSDPGVIWYNVIDSHVSKAYTSCYPRQFYNSVVAGNNGQEWPAFNKIVCPATWESYPINSTYVVCCPQ